MAHASSPRLLALHALRLKGVAEADEVAEYVDGDPEVGAMNVAGSKSRSSAARRDARPLVSNVWMGAMPDAPARSASIRVSV